jgi:RNA polymerase sigma-70 factor (ECF subfamily)
LTADRQNTPSRLRPPRNGGRGGTATPDPSPSQASRFRSLVLPHLDNAYSLARYLCRDATAAEDIAQDAMLKAWRAFAGYQGGDAKAWLLAIVRNAYFDWARANRRWRAMGGAGERPEDFDHIADETLPTAEAALIQRGDAVALRAAIEAMPEAFRETLVLREFEAMSYRAISETTDVPVGTVMSRLARARGWLGQRLGVALEAAS